MLRNSNKNDNEFFVIAALIYGNWIIQALLCMGESPLGLSICFDSLQVLALEKVFTELCESTEQLTKVRSMFGRAFQIQRGKRELAISQNKLGTLESL